MGSVYSEDTKYDLCAGVVTLDYGELIKTARIAVHYALEGVNEWCRRIRESPASKLAAQWMLSDAQHLAIAMTTLFYLEEGKLREEVIIKNKE